MKVTESANRNSNSNQPELFRTVREAGQNLKEEPNVPFFAPSDIQPKLKVSQPGDPYEKEADELADQVVQRIESNRNVPPIQTLCQSCKEEQVHPKRADSPNTVSSSFQNTLESTKGAGSPLPKKTKAKMERAFGADFSKVRVHTNQESIQMNREVNAQAFANGSDIYFNEGKYNPESTEGSRILAHELTHVLQQSGNESIQRVPAVGGNFGTYRYEGFGMEVPPIGFIQNYMVGNYNIDWYTGSTYVWWHTWSSLWELYDASDQRIDSDSDWPFGTFDIKPSKVNSGVPGDGSRKWSLWYRVTRSNKSSDPDAYPYDYETFDVYALPIKNPLTTLRREVGNVIWEDNFTPAHDGASLSYNVTTSTTRSETDSQTETTSVTISGSQSTRAGVSYKGLTGGFERALGIEATRSIARTHSLSVESSRSESKTFTQGGLEGGVTYRIIARPLFHVIDGTVGLINHRNGIILSNAPNTITGGIRILRGIDLRIIPDTDNSISAQGRWRCDAKCNVEGNGSHCTGHVRGTSSGHPNQQTACREAKRNAVHNAPQGCRARHCRCLNCSNR